MQVRNSSQQNGGLRPRKGIKVKKSIIALAALGIATFNITVQAETLRVATEPTFPPFEMVDSKTGKLTGFDVELTEAIAKRIGATIEWAPMGFDAIIPALLSNSIDMAASGFTITKERAKRIHFTAPVYTSGTTMLVRIDGADKYKKFDDLKNKIICAQIGTAGQMRAEKIPGAQVKKFNTMSEAFLELKNSGCEATISDRPVIGYFMASNPQNSKLFSHQYSSQEANEEMGLVIGKRNKKLQQRVAKALQDMKTDGEFQAITQKWFGK